MGMGNVYLAATTLTGGLDDAFVSKYDTAGNFLWTRQMRRAELRTLSLLASQPMGWETSYLSVLIGAIPYGPFGEGESDAFVAKIADPFVPEPSTLALAAISTLGLAACIQRRCCAVTVAILVPTLFAS